ncbi:MAG: hypothetical protein A2X84_07855 [Desulfuromonadaceae bacterium GWC2_58_13]|nr:MAG: hypothetical protein A2X84_07855 [Desulfuromonadaceae bacterium GWC2_58_13]
MFEWDKACERLEVAPERVRRLLRSLGDTQVALPGLPSQKSSAYLCAYEDSRGVQVVVVFHLLVSRRLAVYRHDQGRVAPQNLKAVLDEGMHFAESLGFLLDDQEFHLLDPPAKKDRWNSLPLVHGGGYGLDEPAAAGGAPAAAVPELPSLEELHERRRFFIEKLGRFLATL